MDYCIFLKKEEIMMYQIYYVPDKRLNLWFRFWRAFGNKIEQFPNAVCSAIYLGLPLVLLAIVCAVASIAAVPIALLFGFAF